MILNKIKAAVIFTAAFLFLSINVYAGSKKNVVKYQHPEDFNMWKFIYAYSKAYEIPHKMPAGIVIPHHDITRFNQNSFYKALAQQGQPEVIVIIAPDHFEVGKKLITLPKNTVFDAPGGQLEIAEKEEKAIIKDPLISKQLTVTAKPWVPEHGIFIHTPFIKKYFPNAKILPILLKSYSDHEDFETYQNLGKVLNKVLPENSLVIASVDFSHYQIPAMTEFHDYVSMNTIQNKENLETIEVDSPETLTAVTTYCNLRGAVKPVLIDRTSTFDYINDENVVSTSHQYWTFYSPEDDALIQDFYKRAQNTEQRLSTADYEKFNQTLMIGGSGRGFGKIIDFWKWERTKPEDKTSIKYQLYDFAGSEFRFLNGFYAFIAGGLENMEYVHKKHGTTLYLNSITVNSEKTLENLLVKTDRIQNPDKNQLNVLIINTDGKVTAEDLITKTVTENYNLAVVTNGDGSQDAYAFIIDGKKITQTINLGILNSTVGKPSKGNVLCLNWYDGKLYFKLFDYQSQETIPPAINQGEI